ncbi:hypothetical protein [Streptomyces yaizuensis]|uniref:Uncharacterized protein n=1 Tax=Streptomyces yaizuensis TaxID=2989713 RepID=A0ABQ5NVB3_9ACTN|nr:hypothetical protein [Streptomyces sp. YSPA8]GLF94308.1 hypothetical protein SYYSPA8_08445 [Streptomyces sp. YSPA8]
MLNFSFLRGRSVQHEPIDPGVDGDEVLDPDAWVWTQGVDYLAGWRRARDAAAGLAAAMDAAGIDTSGMTATADAAPDGSGLLRLSLPAETAFSMARVIREGAVKRGESGVAGSRQSGRCTAQRNEP